MLCAAMLPLVALTSRKRGSHDGHVATPAPSLGARIRRARERARLSQEELATMVGASVRAVGDWENDRRKPRNRLGALEDVLGISLDGGGPAAGAGLVPEDAWEAEVLASEILPDHVKDELVLRSRAAREQYRAETEQRLRLAGASRRRTPGATEAGPAAGRRAV